MPIECVYSLVINPDPDCLELLGLTSFRPMPLPQALSSLLFATDSLPYALSTELFTKLCFSRIPLITYCHLGKIWYMPLPSFTHFFYVGVYLFAVVNIFFDLR